MRQPGDRSPAPPALELVQDLANTIDIEMARDTLRSPADLAQFAHDHGVKELRPSRRDLGAILEFRELVRDACAANAGHDVPSASLDRLNEQLGEAPLKVTIDETGSATLAPADRLKGSNALVAHLAAAIATAQAAGTWRRLKACEAHNCRWVFYDRSPAGRGRWCTMSICGSRAKMRAYRDRNGGARSRGVR